MDASATQQFQIIALGVGSAFTLPPKPKKGERPDLNACDFQSNFAIRGPSGRYLILDAGGDLRFALFLAGISLSEIDGVYISHLHNDHNGGMENLALATYFNKDLKRPALYCYKPLMTELWNKSLKGGLETLQGKQAELSDFFDLRQVRKNGEFVWDGIRFELIQTVHIVANRTFNHSFGLMIQGACGRGPKVFWTSDTQFAPSQICTFYDMADLVLHDCETAPFKSKVHAHYDDLCGLSEEERAKMLLYHYQPGAREQRKPKEDGFIDFMHRGDTITITPNGIILPRELQMGTAA